MNKRDIPILVLLVAIWLAWPVIDRKFVKPLFPARPAPVAAEADQVAEAGPAEVAAEPVVTEEPSLTAPEEPSGQAVEPGAPAEIVVIENDVMAVAVSSRGGSVQSVTLKGYPVSIKDVSPVVLDFGSMQALRLQGVPGLADTAPFSLSLNEAGTEVIAEARGANGLVLTRNVAIGSNYVLNVTDEFSNQGPEPLSMAGYSMQLGAMRDLDGDAVMKGMVSLGVDTLSPGGDGVQFWGKRIGKLFDRVQKDGDLSRRPVEIRVPPHENPVDWVSAKNKYFVQILTPEGGGELATLYAKRATVAAELENPDFRPRMQAIEEVGALITFGRLSLEPQEKTLRRATYYAGPKKYTELRTMGLHQVDVMEFGRLAWIAKVLLHALIVSHRWLWPHNYGLAIMLLTILIRIVFWPITHKGTESMKRLQEIQPLINAIREKHKDNPQKMQTETMALYKEYKVNPLGGCLPMLIQIPVLFAMFSVLRSAIELRFAPFLWIRDLSGPENIFPFGFALPLVGWDSLNILPILMTVTMYWQQKLTPSAGDPQQQKMMAFMPVMMLFFFYTMPSGLVLYWTTSQVLMIAQQLMQKRRTAAKAAASA